MNAFTDGWDGLHELILFQLEEDGGFSSSIEPKSYHADLHLWTNMDPVVLKQKKSILNKPKLLTISDGIQCRHSWSGDSVYLSEGDGDASIQLNVVCQLGELVLLLLKRLQQTVDLLLCQHDSAVVLRQERRIRHQAYRCSLSL